jgi:hypothetical protein
MEESSMSLFIVAITICTVMSLAVLLDKPIKRLLEK